MSVGCIPRCSPSVSTRIYLLCVSLHWLCLPWWGVDSWQRQRHLVVRVYGLGHHCTGGSAARGTVDKVAVSFARLGVSGRLAKAAVSRGAGIQRLCFSVPHLSRLAAESVSRGRDISLCMYPSRILLARFLVEVLASLVALPLWACLGEFFSHWSPHSSSGHFTVP